MGGATTYPHTHTQVAWALATKAVASTAVKTKGGRQKLHVDVGFRRFRLRRLRLGNSDADSHSD